MIAVVSLVALFVGSPAGTRLAVAWIRERASAGESTHVRPRYVLIPLVIWMVLFTTLNPLTRDLDGEPFPIPHEALFFAFMMMLGVIIGFALGLADPTRRDS